MMGGVVSYKHVNIKRSLLREVLRILDGFEYESDNKKYKHFIDYLLSNELVSAEELLNIIDEIENGQLVDIFSSKYYEYILSNPNLNDEVFEKICLRYKNSIKNGMLYGPHGYEIENISIECLKKQDFTVPGCHPCLTFDDLYVIRNTSLVTMHKKEIISSGRFSIEECLKLGFDDEFIYKFHPNAEKKEDIYNKKLDYNHEELEKLVMMANHHDEVILDKNLNIRKILEKCSEGLGPHSRSNLISSLIHNQNFDYDNLSDLISIEEIQKEIQCKSRILPPKIIMKFCPEKWYLHPNPTLQMLEERKYESIPSRVFRDLVY